MQEIEQDQSESKDTSCHTSYDAARDFTSPLPEPPIIPLAAHPLLRMVTQTQLPAALSFSYYLIYSDSLSPVSVVSTSSLDIIVRRNVLIVLRRITHSSWRSIYIYLIFGFTQPTPYHSSSNTHYELSQLKSSVQFKQLRRLISSDSPVSN
jgi:hypothetical protein